MAQMKRMTNQRHAIQEIFGKTDRPLGVEEILQAGRKTVRSLNQATVYRNLKLLVEDGWLKKIDAPGVGPVYERAGKDTSPFPVQIVRSHIRNIRMRVE